MSAPREQVLSAIERSLRKIMVFRGLEGADVEFKDETNPILDLGLKSGDLVNVGPDLEAESEDLNVPNEVLDWADDSSGKRRYRSIGEVTDLIVAYLAKEETARHE